MKAEHTTEPGRPHSVDEIRDFFDFLELSPRDQRLFNADLNNLLRDWECPGDSINSEQFDRIVTALSHWGWYQRGRDTQTHSVSDDHDSTSPAGEGRLLDAKSAAKYLGLSDSQFTKLAAKGHLPFVCVSGEVHNNGRGQHKKYRREDLDEWAAENVVGGNRR